ncbi:MAG: hypothetical protein HZC24_05740 [Rhodocyclales bacterium]|nr:hypothetical protein [Rhodocyclales bacterium]
MKKIVNLVVVVFLALLAISASARTIKIPENRPVIAVDIPDAWEPEGTDRGVGAEDPDEVVTVFFEVAASEKQMNRLIDEGFEWLTQEHGLKINGDSKSESEIAIGGVKSTLLNFDAMSKEFGAAKVGFILAPIEEVKRLLVITYWITAKEFTDKHDAALSRIFASVRPLR